jgi:Rps23 Pro-64 3,4-dihydroxylase Tpa1-like proline 4-hydroxylase
VLSLPATTVDYERLDRLIEEGLPQHYASAEPFAHTMIEDFLRPEAASAAAHEVAITEIAREKNFYGTFEKYKLSDSSRFGSVIARIMEELNGPEFISRLEKITGIAGLRADPTLEGGGIHRIGHGGYLKVHTDFNFHRHSQEYRRLNLLVYLNEDWDEAWGGGLELWTKDMKERAAAYQPLFNRAVLFTTTDESYHGHPDPLQSPEGRYRHSLALYYYTKEAPVEGKHFDASTMTNYQPRPGEQFDGSHRLHQAQIRFPLVRRLLKSLKGLIGR